MDEVSRLVPTPFRAATFRTMIGLLAATGMRVGEVIALSRSDIDWADGVLTVRHSKFDKSREVPLDPSTVQALRSYSDMSYQSVPAPTSHNFFVSGKGTPVIYPVFGELFRRLVGRAGVGDGAPRRPRIHDIRH
jgi:integrase